MPARAPLSDRGRVNPLPPLSLYVHVPWCLRKCPYCDFNSHSLRGDLPSEDYLQALFADLEQERADAAGRSLETVFIGGGTPSLMEAAFYERLLERLDQRLGLASNAEITLEANPGTFERARFAGYRRAGINRLSLGVQSFNDTRLQQLGRIHTGAEAVAAAEAAQALGFSQINLDLMHGLPGQSVNQALEDLEQALALAPQHLSWYQLTLEPHTLFHARPPVLPGEEELDRIQTAGSAHLAAAGLRRYEVSAFAQGSNECRHNRHYWEFGDYLALGAGAHAKVTRAGGGVWRRRKAASPAAYMAAPNPVESIRVAEVELPLEFMLNALRLTRGVPAALFAQRTGCTWQQIAEPLGKARELGLMTADDQRLAPTDRGLRFLNELVGLFLE